MALIDKASLLMVPSVYEDGTLYNVLPSGNKAPDETGNHNGYDQTRADFTFSRGSNLAATRVNANGLIEKGRENLLLQSNNFNTTWIKNSGGTFTSGQSGYDGTNDAWQFNVTTASNSGAWQNVSFSGVATFSAYFKKGTIDKIGFTNYAGTAYECWFDLTNGTIGQQTGDLIDAKIEAVGTDGWYRCSITDIASGTNYFQLKPSNAFSGTSTAGSIFIQDAQVEMGLVSTDYIETGSVSGTAGVLENTPRIDYSSGAGALLLEPQRTNLVAYSEYFETYTYYGSPTITHNNIISPEGLLNGTKVVRGTNAVPIRVQSITSLGTEYTMSIWAKAGTASQISIDIGNESAPTYDLTSEWQRFQVTSTPSSSTHIDITMPTASVGEYIYIYGLQLEAGSYVSSYVPTYGSAATRGAELCKKTDINDVIGGTQGTIFFDVTMSESLTNTNYKQFFYYTDSGGTNQTYMYVSNTNYIVGNPNLGNIISSTQMEAGQRYKIAVTYATNSFKMYVNGSQDATSSSGTPKDNENIISIGSYNGTSEFNEFTFNQYIHFKEVLSDSELATLTTL
jgi:hypothetical protein